MTRLSAARFGLTGRGVISVGAYADLCVFDADCIIDRASFAEPTLPATGIEHVFVNGRPVWSEARPTGERPGRGGVSAPDITKFAQSLPQGLG